MIRFKSSLEEQNLCMILRELTITAAFSLRDFCNSGSNVWQLIIAPKSSTVVVSFTKFAELQLRMARFGEVLELKRLDAPEPSATSEVPVLRRAG